MFRTKRIFLILATALAAMALPVLVGAQAPRAGLPPHKGPHPSELRAAWDGKVQGRQVVTALVASFEDAEAYRDFLAGRIPFTLTLRSAVSGQTVRIPPPLLVEGLRPAPGNTATWVIAIDDLRAPVWDSSGCIESRLSAEPVDDGRGAAITIAYAPCSGAPATYTQPLGGMGSVARTDSRSRVASPPPVDCTKVPYGDPRCPQFGIAEAPSMTGAAPAGGTVSLRCPNPRDPTCPGTLGMTAGSTIPGVGVVVKRNPGGGAARVTVSAVAARSGRGTRRRASSWSAPAPESSAPRAAKPPRNARASDRARRPGLIRGAGPRIGEACPSSSSSPATARSAWSKRAPGGA